MVRRVTGERLNKIRTIEVGSGVYRNEVIETDARSSTLVVFADETTLTLGASSSLILDSMVYDPDTNQGALSVKLITGVFKFVSGKMNSNSYRIGAPNSIIGIRGTVIDIVANALTGTSLVLRRGAATISNLTGQTEVVSTVGFFSNVDIVGNPPTPQAPVPQSIELMLEAELVKPIENAASAQQKVGAAGGPGGTVQTALKAPNAQYSGALAWNDPPLFLEIRDWYCAGDKLQDAAAGQQLATQLRELAKGVKGLVSPGASEDEKSRALIEGAMRSIPFLQFKEMTRNF